MSDIVPAGATIRRQLPSHSKSPGLHPDRNVPVGHQTLRSEKRSSCFLLLRSAMGDERV